MNPTQKTDPLRIQILSQYENKNPIHSDIHTHKQKNKFIPSAAFTPVHDCISLSLSQGSMKRRLAFFITVLKTKNKPINQGQKPEKKSKKAMADESVSYMFNAEKLCREDAGRLGFRVEAFAPLSGNNSQGRDTKKPRERVTEMVVMLKCPKQSKWEMSGKKKIPCFYDIIANRGGPTTRFFIF
jgi:hypothetical protein